MLDDRVNIEDRRVEVDPRLFFQRLIVIQPEEINDAFSYEFCIRPSSLFDKIINPIHQNQKLLYWIS